MRKIKQLSLSQRPREKLLSLGAESLTDAELLAIFLRVGVRGKNAIELADELIEQYSLDGIFKLQPQQVKGIGQAKIAQIRATLELTKRYLKSNPTLLGESINQPQSLIQQLQLRLKNAPREIFLTVFMNSQHQVICIEEMFQGTINQCHVYPREIARRALELNAVAIIISHNHPSGNFNPSTQDRHMTEKTTKALALIDIRLLDHIIIAGNGYYSFAEKHQI